MLKRKNIVLTFLFTMLVALVCLYFSSGMMTANAASYSDSGKYKFDLNVGMSIMSGGNPTGQAIIKFIYRVIVVRVQRRQYPKGLS